MANENLEVSRTEDHDNRMDELIRENAELTLKLQAAESNVISLEVEIGQLLNRRTSPSLRTKRLMNDTGSVPMAVTRQKDAEKSVPRHSRTIF